MHVVYAVFTLSVLIEPMICDPGVKSNLAHLISNEIRNVEKSKKKVECGQHKKENCMWL